MAPPSGTAAGGSDTPGGGLFFARRKAPVRGLTGASRARAHSSLGAGCKRVSSSWGE
jgi:hypothetical protein